MAAAGSAVGLGNIWRFPYTAGENGGGAFVLIYLLCVALIGIPVMVSEIMIGRAAQKQPVAAFHELQGKRTAWAGVGWMGVVAGFIILSYYIVIAGWAMDYTLKSVINFTGPIATHAEAEGLEYRATTSPDDMRTMLVQHHADREYSQREKEIKRSVRPSAWDGYEQFQAAVAAAPDAVAAEAALLEDADLRAQVDESRAIQSDLDAARQTIEQDLTAEYSAKPDSEVRDEAEDLVRRNATRDRVGAVFGAVAGDGWITMFWTALFMFITIVIVAGGIQSGIERACVILLPTLFLLIMVLVVYGMFTRGFGEALSFVLKPDIHEIKPSSVLEAMGQGLFSLSLGMGAMITYGSYQRTKSGLAGQAVTIAGLDTAVALLACFMIFPVVFSFGLDPSAGPGLVFVTMPLAFAEIGQAGMLLGTIFFGLLVFAALTSAISLLEVVASYFIDERGWTRRKAAWTLGILILVFAIPSALSGDKGLAMPGWQASYGEGFDFLSTMDYLASNWMLPAGAFFISIYAGWVMPKRLREAEVEGLAPALFMGWLFLARFFAPAAVILILLQSIGVLDADELFHGLVN